MKRNPRQSGFSLMEVMLAVAILAMGLVFIASMFPVGLDNTRKVTDKTMASLAMQSAEAELLVRLEQIRDNQSGLIGPATTGRVIFSDGLVHFMPQVNARIDFTGQFDTIMDDPTGFSYPLVPASPALYPYQDNTILSNYQRPIPFYYFHNNDNATPQIIFPGNLGQVVYPPVTASDEEVQRLATVFIAGGALPYEAESMAQYRVSLVERKFSTAVFYQRIRGGSQQTYKMFIFTLRKLREDARYAVQNSAGYSYVYPASVDTSTLGLPFRVLNDLTPMTANQDRAFPTPWLVRLSTGIRFVVANEPTTDYFEVSGPVASLLRKGSYIIDADTDKDPDYDLDANPNTPATVVPTTTPWGGFLYKVLEVETLYDNAVNGDRYYVKLATPLRDDLNYFWVFPPPIDRNADPLDITNWFEPKQPVVDVKTRIISF